MNDQLPQLSQARELTLRVHQYPSLERKATISTTVLSHQWVVECSLIVS